MGWLVAVVSVLLLGQLPVGLSTVYSEAGPRVRLILGPVRWLLYPGAKKNKSEKKRKSGEKGGSTVQKSKKGGKLSDFLPMIDSILEFLRDFHRVLVVRDLELRLVLAGGDPCDLAVSYGRAWATLGNLVPQLERLVKIKKRNLDVGCDFASDQSLIYVRADLTVRLGRLLTVVLHHGVRILMKYNQILNQRKGGAKA